MPLVLALGTRLLHIRSEPGASGLHLLAELLSMFTGLSGALYLMIRHGQRRQGAHYWIAISLLILATMTGFHAMAEEPAARDLMIRAGLILSGLTALPALGRPQPRPLWAVMGTPLAAVLGCGVFAVGITRPAPALAAAAGPWLDAATLVSVAAFGLVAWRLHRDARRTGFLGLHWLAAYGILMALATLRAHSAFPPGHDWFLVTPRLAATLTLLVYAMISSAREFNTLGRAEEELRRSAARFRAITENTSDIIFLLDSDGVFTYMSPAAARVAGVKPEELIGRPPGRLTHEDDRPLIHDGLARAKASPGESVQVGPIRVRHADGRWIRVEGVYTCLDHDPDVRGTVMNYRDVSEREASQRELADSRERLSHLIRNLPGLVYRCRPDEEFSLEYVSDYSRQILGYMPEEFLDAEIVCAADIIHPEDLVRVRTSMRRAVDDGQPIREEYRVIHRDGSVRWVMERGAGIYGANGTLEAVEGIIIDITELVQSRRELQRTKFAVDHGLDALYWVDRWGRIVDVNGTACHYLGYERRELIGKNLWDISADLEAEDWARTWEWVKEQGAVLVEGEHVTRTGRRYPVEISSLFLEFGGEQFHCCFVRDISDRKEAERQIQRMNQDLERRVQERTAALEEAQEKLVTSEKMAALGNLVAGVAHEINTPLGIGVTAASHLDRKVREMEAVYREGRMKKSDFEALLGLVRETAGLMLTNLKRAAELVQGFKQVSVDQSSEQRRVFVLDEYLREVVQSLDPELKRRRHGVDLHCDRGVEVDGYPGALAQVVTNLILNSVKHGFEDKDQGRIWIHVDAGTERIRILYKDDGQGMNAEQVRRLYEPFYTTKRGRGGSGLGMNIVFNLVTQLLGGTIECQSDLGQGTVFVLEFPRIAPRRGEAGLETPLPVGAGR
ncbi:MAG TPA: PAS domain S-box protein [Candidatus Krumholzibacteria bacterium]|nr:PAS domain S-box protein [Candidatus Krumholzibacteria bacterium]HRX51031.1 PAS domain S-box protein [Candidatus Krumholzibacteria bacterium]